MRLKAGKHEYKLPSDIHDYYGCGVTVGSCFYWLSCVSAEEIIAMRKRKSKVRGVPSFCAIMTKVKNKYLLVYPSPEKAWKLELRVTRVHVL